MLTQNQIGVLYMVASVICFSIMDICVKWLDYYPVGQVLFLRFFIGFIPIFFIIPKDKLFSFYKTSRPGLHAFRAITGALAIIALFYGLRELPLADVVSLTFGGPIFVTVASIFFLSEKVGFKRWSAVFLGFVGVCIALIPNAELSNSFDNNEWLLGVLLAFASAIFFSLYQIGTRALANTDSPVTSLIFSGLAFE